MQVREMVRDFSRTNIAPVAAELDRTSTFPWENIKAMGELGLLGVPWAEELGGAGMDQLSYYITIHEMAKVDASHALTISAHTNLGTSPIVEFGTEEQKRRYVPLLASGQVLGGFGLTEPGRGKRCRRHRHDRGRKGDHYLLNGSKIFITHAGVGEVFVGDGAHRPRQGTRASPASSSPRTPSTSTHAGSWASDTRGPAQDARESARARSRRRWVGAPATLVS